ncbi:MAG: winged helix-turn-helix transcriptional regulator [Clostridium sp.]|nr:winged helix-turn-helix transcriptional regulator [Clostridium sp.]
MLYFNSLKDASEVIKALSAPMRLKIMEIIYEDGDKNLNELANMLNLTNSAISLHIKKLQDAGLIEIHTMSGKRGSMKICKPIHDTITINLRPENSDRQSYTDDISVGCYSSCQVEPTCGLATSKKMIGEFDDPRYFFFPEHFNAEILWFTSGYVEYNFPNHLIAGQKLTELKISFEISSECPGFNEDFPSDIYFSINDIPLGFWISPGDFGSRKGRFNPDWWPELCNQYGRLKTLSVNDKGTFIDGGVKISNTTIDELNIDYLSTISFKFSAPADTKNPGGLTIFGKNFGDYNQSIKVESFYETSNN